MSISIRRTAGRYAVVGPEPFVVAHVAGVGAARTLAAKLERVNDAYAHGDEILGDAIGRFRRLGYSIDEAVEVLRDCLAGFTPEGGAR
jgi:hypothetical protein